MHRYAIFYLFIMNYFWEKKLFNYVSLCFEALMFYTKYLLFTRPVTL